MPRDRTGDSPVALQQPHAWLWVILLMAGYAISVIDRIGIGLLIGPIKRDLLVSDTALGLIQGAAFGVFYIGLALPLGQWIDRGNRRVILILGILVWSSGTLVGALATGAAGLFGGRLLIGAGEATLMPTAASIIGDLFSERRRPLAFGIFTMGVGLGSGIAFFFTGAVFEHSGAINQYLAPLGFRLADWRLTFVAMGLPGFVLVLLLWVLVREPARRSPLQPGQGTFADVKRAFLANPRPYLGVTLGAAMLQFTGTIMISWFPTVLVRSHGLAPGEVGGILGPIAIAVGIPSALSAGLVLAWLSRFNAARAPFILLGLGTLCYSLTCIAALGSRSLALAIFWFGCSALFSNWAIPAALSGLALLAPPVLRGKIVAIQMMVIGMISLGVGPALTGFVADRFFPFAGGIALAATLLVAAACVVGLLLLGMGYRAKPEVVAAPG